MSDIPNYLGMRKGDPALSEFFRQLGTPQENTIEHLNYLDFLIDGICFLFNKEMIIISIFLYSEGIEYHSSFKREMPSGLQFSQSRTQVRQALPPPCRSGGGQIGMLGRLVKPWDKFQLNNTFITVTYSQDQNNIDLITISFS